MATYIETVKARINTCSKCPELRMGRTLTCNECGCVIKLKAILITETCPLNKWETDNTKC